MIEKVGFRPTREWVESTFKVELEDPEETKVEGPLQEIPPEESEEEEAPVEEEPTEETEEEEGEMEDPELEALISEILGE